MATAKRTHDNSTAKTKQGTPNPKEKKAPRSILKGKKPDANDKETMEIEGNEVATDNVVHPPMINRAKGLDDALISSNLNNKFEATEHTNEDNEIDSEKNNGAENAHDNHKNKETNKKKITRMKKKRRRLTRELMKEESKKKNTRSRQKQRTRTRWRKTSVVSTSTIADTRNTPASGRACPKKES